MINSLYPLFFIEIETLHKYPLNINALRRVSQPYNHAWQVDHTKLFLLTSSTWVDLIFSIRYSNRFMHIHHLLLLCPLSHTWGMIINLFINLVDLFSLGSCSTSRGRGQMYLFNGCGWKLGIQNSLSMCLGGMYQEPSWLDPKDVGINFAPLIFSLTLLTYIRSFIQLISGSQQPITPILYRSTPDCQCVNCIELSYWPSTLKTNDL